MKNVLYVHDGPRWRDYSGNLHGTQDDLKQISRYKYLGDSVDFMMRLFDLPSDLKGRTIKLNEHDVKVIAIPPFNRPYNLFNYFKSKKIISNKIGKYDILVIRLPSTIGSLALKLAKKQDIPYLIEVVACPWDALWNHSFLGKLYAPFSFLKLRRQMKDVPFSIYVTEEFLQHRYPSSGRSVSISDVMLDPIDENTLDKKIHRYSNLDKNDIITLSTIAAIDVSYKGHRFVLKAMSRLKKEGFKFKYLIIGSGSKDNIEKLVLKYQLAEEVEILGLVEHEKIFSHLKETDIYIQPSLQEGLPRAVIESMSCACVCIGSSTGGIPELLDSSAIFKRGDAFDLTDKLRSIIDNDKMVEQAKKNFEKAKSYETEYLNHKRENFYDEFLSSI